jgi:putative membrane-bound dehydrogenase-like protein
MNLLRFFALHALLLMAVAAPLHAEPLRIGVAKQDVTPDYPIRLNGFAARKTESDGISGRIWVKALAFLDEREGPAILITTDNLGIPASIASEVAARLGKQVGLKPERLIITATHTHSAPMLRGVANPIFGHDLAPEEWEHIMRYTQEFTDALEAVALAAVKDAQPATLATAKGQAGFAINRRTKGGPTDHDLPILVVRAPDGKVRAVWFSYACHCVTLSQGQINGDWAGAAMEEIERDFPGAVALASVGCGADQNPNERNTLEIAAKQGREVADEVKRLIGGALTPITAAPTTRRAEIELAYDTPRTREEWMDLLKKGGQLAYYARLNLMRLDHGEKLPTQQVYPVQTWRFGDELAVVFLAGEVVVDYSLRLKRELRKVITIGYANDAPAYIPSERILTEGGYEGAGAMIYYDRPHRFAPGLEQKIVEAVHAQLPNGFRVEGGGKGTEGTKPLPPGEALRTLKTKPGLVVELVASEPLVQSPVAIDWGADGRLWVCEMFDYPTGLDEKWKPGGRIKVLTDTDGDSRYDRATVFLEGLPFPTGVTAWGRGALICAAPDILYAEDTDGDGRADKVEKLFSGFATDNYQARVNSLTPGLDGWMYGANGLLGGKIHGGAGGDVDLGKRDFRFKVGTRAFEPAGGFTQFGRVRDDWGRWYGCENSLPLYHFPLPDHYLARNPRVAAPGSRVSLTVGGGRCYPIAQELPRYNNPQSEGRFTAACGLGIYRAALLGAEFRGNAFTCEPAHNLVSRALLSDGPLPAARRADDERESEFLASTDVWFRPVQARTGPDGALYVVDMYRFLIEHPRWIAADRMSRIDARAGAELGRIYRLVPEGTKVPAVRDLKKLNAAELAAALDAPSGTERDRVQLELLARKDTRALPVLGRLLREAQSPEVIVHALCLLDLFGELTVAELANALDHPQARVREQAVRISERFFAKPVIATRLAGLADDPDLGVRLQLAFTLGEWSDPRAARALQQLASSADVASPWFRAAVESSAAKHPVQLPARAVAAAPKLDEAAMKKLVAQMLTGATGNRAEVLKQFAPALALAGHAGHGGEIFAQRCTTCHRLDTTGFDVGPSLAPLRDKPADYWLKNILDPNAIVEPASAGAIFELNNGRTLAGVVKAETATSFTVAAPGGGTETILRGDVKSRKAAPVSLMPEGLEAGLTPQDAADLIAFLRSAPKPGNQPAPVAAGANGALLLSAKRAEIRGPALVFENDFANLGFWHGPDDHAAWTVQVAQPGEYDVWLDAACAPDSAGNPFTIHAGPAELRGTAASTGAWSKYARTKIGRVTLPAGELRVTMFPAAPPRQALLDLRALAVVPAGREPSWPGE